MDASETMTEIPRGTDLRSKAERDMWASMKWRALFALLEKNGHLQVSELAKTVGLSANEALSALESMQLLGMIKRTDNGYAQTDVKFKRTTINSKIRAEVVSDFVLSADQVINRLAETPNSSRHQTRSVIYNSSHDLVKKMYEKIDKAIEEFKIESDNAKETWDGVYAFSLALVDVTGELKND